MDIKKIFATGLVKGDCVWRCIYVILEKLMGMVFGLDMMNELGGTNLAVSALEMEVGKMFSKNDDYLVEIE